MDLVAGILRFVGSFAAGVFGQLGIGGTLWAVVGLLLLGVIVKWVDRADRLLERAQRRWRKWSKGTRWSVMFLAAVFAGPAVWQAFPKTPGVAALALGGYAFYWYQGLRFVERYDLVDATPHRAWAHHLEASRSARKHTSALADGSGKKGGRARKPVPTPEGHVVTVEPPHGESDEETAERYESQKMNSTLAHQFGWEVVQDVTAHPVGDGTVEVQVRHAQTKDDFFDASHPWPGMES